jgi:hypothetical protein
MLNGLLCLLFLGAWGGARGSGASLESHLRKKQTKLQAQLDAKNMEVEGQNGDNGAVASQYFVIRDTVIKFLGGKVFWRDVLGSQGYVQSPHTVPAMATIRYVAEENGAETILVEDFGSATIFSIVLTLKGEPYLTVHNLSSVSTAGRSLIRGSMMATQTGREVLLFGKDYRTSVGTCWLDSGSEKLVGVSHSPKKNCLFIYSQNSMYFFDKGKKKCFLVHKFPQRIADARLISRSEGEVVATIGPRGKKLVIWRFKSNNQLAFERKIRFSSPGLFIGNDYFVVNKSKEQLVLSVTRLAEFKHSKVSVARLSENQTVVGCVMLDELTRVFTADPQTGFLEHRRGTLLTKFQPFKDVKIPKITYLFFIILSITWALSFLKKRQEKQMRVAKEQALIKLKTSEAKNRQLNSETKLLSASINHLQDSFKPNEKKFTNLR